MSEVVIGRRHRCDAGPGQRRRRVHIQLRRDHLLVRFGAVVPGAAEGGTVLAAVAPDRG